MDDLIAFLRARLDEDEQTARDATEGPWFADHPERRHWGDDPESALIVRGKVLCILDNQHNGPLNGDHIARHSPTRVLAEVEAKREVVRIAERAHDYHETFMSGFAAALEQVLRLCAVAYAAHPDYREVWRP